MNFKFLILALVSLALFRLLYLVRKERVTLLPTLFWGVLWGVIGFFTIFTRLADTLMNSLMMENRMEFILIGGLLLLYVIVYNFSLALKQIEQKLSKLVQAMALLEYELEGERSGKQSQEAAVPSKP